MKLDLIFLQIFPIFLLFCPCRQSKIRPTFKEYCAVNISNTPCKYRCRRAAQCGHKHFEYHHLSYDDKMLCLHMHNALRDDVAGGKYDEQGFPPAADMRVLSWDKESEWMAACYIVQCQWSHDLVRQSVGDNENMGQNLYQDNSNKKVFPHVFYRQAIMSWFGQRTKLEKKRATELVNSFDEEEVLYVTAFTQMQWSRTKYVGCAKYNYQNETLPRNQLTFFFFCNYFPQGNVHQRPVYKVGDPASKCPKGTKMNNRYPNLCGEIREFQMDPYVGPTDLDPKGTYQFKQAMRRHYRKTHKKRKRKNGQKQDLDDMYYDDGKGGVVCSWAVGVVFVAVRVYWA